jgi:hypothetical protein
MSDNLALLLIEKDDKKQRRELYYTPEKVFNSHICSYVADIPSENSYRRKQLEWGIQNKTPRNKRISDQDFFTCRISQNSDAR